mmetsp:Transcript_5696/g.5894  ORF Transcript_5696/g.5894 Transcript_5696/m.5894 type:complete len:273 (+) Transcript_5696:226-1044(+)
MLGANIVIIVLSIVRTAYCENESDFQAVDEVAVKSMPVKLKKIRVDHEMDSQFSSRTVFTLHQKRTNSKIEPGMDTLSNSESELFNGISESHVESFKTLLSSNGLYRIRFLSKSTNESSPLIYAAIPACELQKSGFKDEITLYLDKYDDIISMDYSAPVTALPRPCDPSKITGSIQFQTKVKVADRLFAQSIPLNAMGPVPEDMKKSNVKIESLATGEQDQQKNKSFLFKYWYIILPITLIAMFGSPEPKPAGGETATGATKPSVTSSAKRK